MELYPSAICNLGAGVSTGLSTVAAEEGLLDAVVLTNEQGLIGGAPITGRDSGGAQNFAAMIEQTSQFDFYDGGGLDLAFLSFAEVDAQGNVNISRFGDKIVGVGGFVNISQNAKRVIFSGTFTAGGLDVQWTRGRATVVREGQHRKFVSALEQISYSAAFARQRGNSALFVTERAVFRAGEAGLELIEIAPGIDLERDIFGQMAFRTPVASDVREMDVRLFGTGLMGLAEDMSRKERRYRSERVAEWSRTHG
jgi:propionate CoA-transferase